MNERPVRETAADTKTKRKARKQDNQSPTAGEDTPAEHSTVRPGQPDGHTDSTATNANPGQGLLQATANGTPQSPGQAVAPGAGYTLEAPINQTMTEAPAQEDVSKEDLLLVVRALGEKVAAQERALTNMIQELQARNGMVSAGTGSNNGQGITGVIGNIANAIASVIQKIPTASSENTLTSQIVQNYLALGDAVTQVVLKNSGIGLPPPVQHMPIAAH